jgi:hypothetical protein
MRAQWALDLTLSDDTAIRTVGFEVLEALANSEWADEHEADVIAAATERALDDATARSTPPAWRRRLVSERWR